MLECAVGLDPAYAPAWAALAGRYLNARHYLRDDSMLNKAETAAKKALEINPQLPVAIFWLAVYYAERGDLKQALASCKQLLQAAPNSEYAYQAMGHAYDYAGLPDIALTLFRKAAEINPVAYPYMIGLIYYQKGGPRRIPLPIRVAAQQRTLSRNSLLARGARLPRRQAR